MSHVCVVMIEAMHVRILPVNPNFEIFCEQVPINRQHGLHHACHTVLTVDCQTAVT